MSAASVLEATIVTETRKGPSGGREPDFLLLKAGIETVAFSQKQLRVAHHAFRTYGRGRHAVGLNFGDCFSYAESRTTGEPLLLKDDHFALTDAVPCL